jgi:hypothetical protein
MTKAKSFLLIDGQIENDRIHKMKLLFKNNQLSRDEFLNSLTLIHKDFTDKEKLILLEIAD